MDESLQKHDYLQKIIGEARPAQEFHRESWTFTESQGITDIVAPDAAWHRIHHVLRTSPWRTATQERRYREQLRDWRRKAHHYQ